ncbi:hypothetical protein BDV93DRAFT_448715 [Ceratobasidium sp. AG-I]|nr:hypothetical protein BDV93DRAFT_448715 [Ceratobasidium sp. AG-I]
MYLADIITNSQRVQFSRRHLEILLEYARQTGGKDIPTVSALKKAQKAIKSRIGDSTQRKVSASGTVYYLNTISNSLKQDMANPHVRKHMYFFPHKDGKQRSQAWNGRKMMYDVPDHVLTPCARLDNSIFYVNELVRRQKDWSIPLRWFTNSPKHKLHAFSYVVEQTKVSGLSHTRVSPHKVSKSA